MKKRVLSYVMALTLMVAAVCIPVSVSAADVSMYTDFSDYTAAGMWNATTNSTSGVAPSIPINGKSTAMKFKPSFTAYSGVAAGTATDADADYGISMMQYAKYNPDSKEYVYTYFDTTEMTGSIYMEDSINIAKSTTGSYGGASLRLRFGSGDKYPIGFSNTQKITVFDASTDVSWSPDTWYDIKMWFNLDSGAYKIQVYDGNELIVDESSITTAGEKLTRVMFWNTHYLNHTVMSAAQEYTVYHDNFKLENTDKVIIDEMASLTHYTFDEWDDANGLPATLGKGTWKKGLGGAGTHTIEQIQTDRGYSAKICANETDDISQFSGSTKQDITNPALFLNYGTGITTAAALKVSFMFPDDNFTNIQIKMSNNIIAMQALSNASITAFDGRDTGMKVKLNTWYDLEIVLDYDTGYYTYYLTDGTFEYKDAGFSKETMSSTEAKIYRTWFRINDRMEGNYSEPSAFIIDDFYYGAISKLSAPLYGGNDLSDAEKLSLDLPFKNTKFRYKADITLSDLDANRTLVASTASTSAGVAKFGSDGKLYIGGTEAADISVGTYSAEIIFDQAKYTATVTISKDGAEVATGTAALGTAKVVLETIEWLVDEDSTIEISNVEYRGIYDFALDNVNSSNGTIKASDAVVARFTNALDKTTFNATTVTVNDGEITPEISFVDDNTVKFDFAKAPGSAYTVKFTGVSDLFGNTLSDYIRVTMDEAGGIYLTDVEFTKNGETVEVTTPGTITAKVSAAAYGGDEDVNYTLALYESGRMVACDFAKFTATKTLEEHSLDITIPDDGKHYILKVYINDSDTLEAYAEPAILKATNKPVIILKLDGIGVGSRLTAFEPSYEYAVANNIKMNFGVIARDLGSTDADDVARLDEMENHEMIEFWNHQYAAGNMGNYTREEIFADFENAKTVSEKTGVEYETFNSIENYIHSDIVDALNAYNYKGVLSRASEERLAHHGYLDKDNTFVTLWRTFDVEKAATGTIEDGTSKKNATVCISVEDLTDDWEKAMFQDWPYAVLQYHPVNWPASDLTTSDGKVYSSDYMYDFIEYLKNEGVIFMTTTEYIDYSSILH